MKFEHTETAGWMPAIRGMRNPMNSWDRSDSLWLNGVFVDFGPNDLKLARSLTLAGSEHSKFARMIQVYVDISAPLYWWKEFDTYRAGVEKNSCSTMHKIMSRMLEVEDFAVDEWDDLMDRTADLLNYNISQYKKGIYPKEDQEGYFRNVVQLLPSSYIQKRTVMLSYAALRNIYFQRRHHKLSEWHEFCRWAETLPYAGDLITLEADK